MDTPNGWLQLTVYVQPHGAISDPIDGLELTKDIGDVLRRHVCSAGVTMDGPNLVQVNTERLDGRLRLVKPA